MFVRCIQICEREFDGVFVRCGQQVAVSHSTVACGIFEMPTSVKKLVGRWLVFAHSYEAREVICEFREYE